MVTSRINRIGTDRRTHQILLGNRDIVIKSISVNRILFGYRKYQIAAGIIIRTISKRYADLCRSYDTDINMVYCISCRCCHPGKVEICCLVLRIAARDCCGRLIDAKIRCTSRQQMIAIRKGCSSSRKSGCC